MKKFGNILERVDSSTKLGQLLNRCMDSVDTLRIVSIPHDFERDADSKTNMAILFYETCLIEAYLHSIIPSLNRIKATAKEYKTFDSNWKYYATSKRYDSIKEYGGDDDDYDAEGNITPATDEKLKVYSVVSDLRISDSRDIFISAELSDLMTLFKFIDFHGRNDINDFFLQTTGKRLKTYRMENGKMIENDWADEAINKSSREFASDELSAAVMTVFSWITVLVEKIRDLKKDEDNKDFFEFLIKEVDRILNLELEY